MSEVEKAQQALVDYINSLSPEQRERAIKFQHELELEAAAAPGGWLEVIPRRLAHLWMTLGDAVHELNERRTV